MPRGTRVSGPGRLLPFAYGAVTLYGPPFQRGSAREEFCNSPSPSALGSDRTPRHPSPNGRGLLQGSGFRLLPFRSPLLGESRLISFPPGTKMSQFPGFPPAGKTCRRLGITPAGFPHSGIPGSKPACGSPGLIAACHALHRPPVPRHPPRTLSSLSDAHLP